MTQGNPAGNHIMNRGDDAPGCVNEKTPPLAQAMKDRGDDDGGDVPVVPVVPVVSVVPVAADATKNTEPEAALPSRSSANNSGTTNNMCCCCGPLCGAFCSLIGCLYCPCLACGKWVDKNCDDKTRTTPVGDTFNNRTHAHYLIMDCGDAYTEHCLCPACDACCEGPCEVVTGCCTSLEDCCRGGCTGCGDCCQGCGDCLACCGDCLACCGQGCGECLTGCFKGGGDCLAACCRGECCCSGCDGCDCDCDCPNL